MLRGKLDGIEKRVNSKAAVAANQNDGCMLLGIGRSYVRWTRNIDRAQRFVETFEARSDTVIVTPNQEADANDQSRNDNGHPAVTRLLTGMAGSLAGRPSMI